MITGQNFNRRKMLKASLPVAASVLAAPAIVKSAFASSGELSVMMWPGYLSNNLIGDFMAETGIKVTLKEVASNSKIVDLVQKNEGAYDLVCPTQNRSIVWQELELLQPLDLAKVKTDNLIKPLVAFAETDWNFAEAGPHWLPLVWGAEAVAWRNDKWQPEGGKPSYADLWSEEAEEGFAMGRAFSLMTAAGLVLENEGTLDKGVVWNTHKDEEAMRAAWRQITDWCIARKKSMKSFWKSADDQTQGLRDGIARAQTWDGPALALKDAGEAVSFAAPKEGALVWSDGFAMPLSAPNTEQAYAFLNFVLDQKRAATSVADHRYNSAVVGATEQAEGSLGKNFSDAYSAEDLENLQVWRGKSVWYKTARAEFVKEFLAA